MKSTAKSPDEYISQLPPERREAVKKLRQTVAENLPDGFSEEMIYGMIGYVVSLKAYPKGYHTTPDQPLPFINIASQKDYIALYHMGIYSDQRLLKWFTGEFPKHSDAKLDMGKSCIRFRKPDHIPYKLIGELVSRISMKEWINAYESTLRKK